jgi:hypothetical protein
VEEIWIGLCFITPFVGKVLQKLSGALPGFIVNFKPRIPFLIAKVLSQSFHEDIQGGEALLPVQHLIRFVRTLADHEGLEAIVRILVLIRAVRKFPEILEELCDLSLCPAVSPLIGGDEETIPLILNLTH